MSKTRKKEKTDSRKSKLLKKQSKKIKNFKQFLDDEIDDEAFDYNIKGLK